MLLNQLSTNICLLSLPWYLLSAFRCFNNLIRNNQQVILRAAYDHHYLLEGSHWSKPEVLMKNNTRIYLIFDSLKK